MVCIIEDDTSVLRALKRLVESAGHRVAAFSTAEEFLGSEQPDRAECLILDVHLPGLGGLELQDRLLSEESRLPIIFISAFDDAPARARALKHGAVAFLKKPFNDRSLLKAIDHSLRSTAPAPKAQPSD